MVRFMPDKWWNTEPKSWAELRPEREVRILKEFRFITAWMRPLIKPERIRALSMYRQNLQKMLFWKRPKAESVSSFALRRAYRSWTWSGLRKSFKIGRFA